MGARQHRRRSEVIRTRSRSRGSRRAACRCATTSSPPVRRDCSARRSSRVVPARRNTTCRPRRRPVQRYAAEAGCGDPATAAALPACAAAGEAAAAGVVRPHRHRTAEWPGDGNDVASGRSDDGRGAGAGGQGAGADRHDGRRVQPLHRAAIRSRAPHRRRALSGAARPRRSAPTPRRSRSSIRRIASAAVCRWRIRRRRPTGCSHAWPTGWPTRCPKPTPCTRTCSTIPVCRHRSRCARCRFPSARAIRWNWATCSTWVKRRRCAPAQQQLSDQMIDYWSRFVATGSPGSDWPALDKRDPGARMSLQPDGNHVIADFDAGPPAARSGQA